MSGVCSLFLIFFLCLAFFMNILSQPPYTAANTQFESTVFIKTCIQHSLQLQAAIGHQTGCANVSSASHFSVKLSFSLIYTSMDGFQERMTDILCHHPILKRSSCQALQVMTSFSPRLWVWSYETSGHILETTQEAVISMTWPGVTTVP